MDKYVVCDRFPPIKRGFYINEIRIKSEQNPYESPNFSFVKDFIQLNMATPKVK